MTQMGQHIYRITVCKRHADVCARGLIFFSDSSSTSKQCVFMLAVNTLASLHAQTSLSQRCCENVLAQINNGPSKDV